MIAYQEIPIGGAIELSNSIIVDQGIAVGALIFMFVIVVLFIAVLWRVLGNQRQENKDQGVLVGAVGNLANIIEKFDETASKFANIVEQNDKRSSNDKQATKDAIAEGAAKIEAHTQELEKTKTAVNIMSSDIDKIKEDLEAVKLSLDNIEKIIEDGVCIDADSKELLEGFIERMQLLDIKIATITQETKQVTPSNNLDAKPSEPIRVKMEPTKPETIEAEDKPNEEHNQ